MTNSMLIVIPIAIDLCYRSHSRIFSQPRILSISQTCATTRIYRLAALKIRTSTLLGGVGVLLIESQFGKSNAIVANQ